MSDLVGLQSYVPTITSMLAIAISSLTLGWTIYRDAIRKPKFKEAFLKDNFSQVDVADGFGRIHWASRRDLRKARKKYRKDFPKS
jgi:hypothetical protein